VGAVEVAAIHTIHLAESLCTIKSEDDWSGDSQVLNALSILVETSPALGEYFLRFSSTAGDSVDDLILRNNLLQSANIRGALIMFGGFHKLQSDESSLSSLVRSDDLLSLFLNTLLQICSPVILDLTMSDSGMESNRGDWSLEVVILRAVVVTVLDGLLARCSPDDTTLYPHLQSTHTNSDDPLCALSTPHSSVGGRGLFLLAYQGAALISSHGGGALLEALLSDWAVPSRYNQLVRVTNPHIEWEFTPSLTVDSSGEDLDFTPISVIPLERKPRIVFLSFFLTRHSVGRLLAMIIGQIDLTQFDVYIATKTATPTSARVDDVSAYLHSVVPSDHWLYLPLNLPSAVALLRGAAFDVLVFGDVFMDSFVAHLAMVRVAPVQVAFWGHPFTTGYADSLDYFVTSEGFEAQGRVDRENR
jgi:hypothetical protein